MSFGTIDFEALDLVQKIICKDFLSTIFNNNCQIIIDI